MGRPLGGKMGESLLHMYLLLFLWIFPKKCNCFQMRATTPKLRQNHRSTFIVRPLRLPQPLLHNSPSITYLHSSDKDDDTASDYASSNSQIVELLHDPVKNWSFSLLMVACGAALGPFLDSYHSAFGVLQYDNPIFLRLWGSELQPALITTWWVPELFGLAGFIIGWLYIVLDEVTQNEKRKAKPTLILIGISLFTFQYWLSGVLFAMGVGRTIILEVMTVVSAVAFAGFDCTWTGFIASTATAIGGPMIEVGLLTFLHDGGYHYSDSGEFGFFPLWIVPVYFLGGPAVGNLARGLWEVLSSDQTKWDAEAQSAKTLRPRCRECNDSRCVDCPNCDMNGYYMAYERKVKCNACKGRGLVICRSCFSRYNDDPADIESIRKIMSRMPD